MTKWMSPGADAPRENAANRFVAQFFELGGVFRFKELPARRLQPRRSAGYATNGDRERDRRRRQIAQGKLKIENGLDVWATSALPPGVQL